jgi:hypothetical protein
MKYSTLIIICFISIIAGNILFAYFNGIIIIRSPWHAQQTTNYHAINQKKECAFYYWHHGQWNQEKIELMWSDNKESALVYLLNNWLTYLDEEHIIHKKVTAQTTLFSSNGHELYISLDRNPLDQEQSIHEKLLFIEGLLKTLRTNCTDITSVTFLVDHQPLHDQHLDFSNPWPITGFLTS